MPKKLLFSVTKKDLIIQTFTAGGPGGQHQNRVQTAVRITHKESGAVGEARDSKSQHANIKSAFERMANSKKFQVWIRTKAAEMMEGQTLEDKVDAMMEPKNLKVEFKDGSEWKPFTEEDENNKKD